jgi:hypothetical protein
MMMMTATTMVMTLAGFDSFKFMLNQISIPDFDAVCIDKYLTKIRRKTLPQSSVWYGGSTHPTGETYMQVYKTSCPRRSISQSLRFSYNCVHQRKEYRVVILIEIA